MTTIHSRVRLADSYDELAGVNKVAMLVWDTNALAWIKYSPAASGATSSVAVTNFPPTQAVSGPLTDAQLRAVAVPVSGTVSVRSVGFTVATLTTPTVTTASTTLLASNSSRVYAHVFNNSSAIAYVQYGAAAVVGRGVKLQPGAQLTLSGADLYLGQINAISTQSITLDILEGTP